LGNAGGKTSTSGASCKAFGKEGGKGKQGRVVRTPNQEKKPAPLREEGLFSLKKEEPAW